MSDATTVPPDHEVTLFHMPLEPSVQRSPAGVIIASFGVAGDDADRELENVLTAVDKALAEGTSAMLVNENRELRIDSLFAPATLNTLRVPSPVSWVFHDGSVVSMMASARRREALVMFMQRIAAASIPQAVYMIDPPAPSVVSFVQFMRGLDVIVRHPDTRQGTLAIQVEVKRPDGIFCVLAGSDVPHDEIEDVYKPGELTALEPAALADRVKKIDKIDRPIAFRSPRLRKRMIELETTKDERAMSSLLEELLTRDLPLFMLRDPNSDQLEIRSFSDEPTLPAFADVICLEWAAADMGKQKGSYMPGAVDPGTLIAHAASGKLGLAVCTYRDRETPMYAVIPATLVATLASKLAAARQ